MTPRTDDEQSPVHPFWCDECGGKAAFTIQGCPIQHAAACPRRGEDPMTVFARAKAYCQRTGKAIP
jgi:hypothetical protein